jgi:hypothetical protein
VAIDEKALPPEDWQQGQMRSLLGAALLGQKRYAEAEPLLVSGYNGMKDAPAASADRKRLALARVVLLYESWNRAQPSASRSRELATWQAALPATTK